MFIRVKTTPNSPRKSVQIIESIRTGNKVRQKIIRHVGIAMDDAELVSLKDLAEHIKVKLENEHQAELFPAEEKAQLAIKSRTQQEEEDKPLNVNLKELREEQRAIVGIHEVYGKVYEELGFNAAIPNPARTKKANELLFEMVMARIANPVSKRESVNMLEQDFGVTIPLQGVYRMMDKLTDKTIEKIQDISFNATKSLLSEKIDVLFYDCTTLYFESFSEDDLKQNGYSKDLKFNQPQVILALMATTEGLPIGYEVFPGSGFEGHTLIPALNSLKERYDLNQVIFVADRGMLSEENISYLEESGLQYIVGARLRNSTKALQAKILASSLYKESGSDSTTKLACFEKEDGRKLIVSHSAIRARKDRHDREKVLDKLQKKLLKSKDPKSLLSNYGYKKYLMIEGKSEIKLNTDKLEKEAVWDGLHGVLTNIKNMPPEQVLNQYRNLWQIEECFRINKHDLKIRPIYHWTPDRVKAHLAICYMAFTCLRHLEYRVKLRYIKLSPEVIRKELTHVQVSFLRNQKTKQQYCIPSKVGQHAEKIYRAMDLKLSLTPFEI